MRFFDSAGLKDSSLAQNDIFQNDVFMIQNVFSWSKSRDEQFRECQRKYFYDKYASWGGWDAKAPREARAAYVLKNLKNRWAWKGETVHHVIENVLKSIRQKSPLSFETASAQLTDTMRKNYRDSKAKKYREDPKRSLGLFEHEYEKPVSDLVWKKIHDESASCLKNFFHSFFYKELLTDDVRSWLLIEDLEEFDFEGAKLYVKLDFARRKEGLIEIYDWKTGKANGEQPSVQLGAYAIYAMKKWGVALEEVRTYLFNLSVEAPQAQNCPVTEDLIRRTREIMAKSIEEMQKLLLDVAKNTPKPREHFKFTENTRLCDFCNFYKICEKYQAPLLQAS